jgi:hypothetical protein
MTHYALHTGAPVEFTTVMAALYYVTASISSVGYGDIHAATQSETVLAILIILFGGR